MRRQRAPQALHVRRQRALQALHVRRRRALRALQIPYTALQRRVATTELGQAVAFSLRDDLILALETLRCKLEHFIEKSPHHRCI